MEAGPRGVELLRPAELRLSRSARTSPSSRSTPTTGAVELKRYVAVDDCGPQINPMIVEGQVHGGVVQGLGQALWEEAVYDDDGQLLTGSLMDYAIPARRRAARHRGLSTVTPSPHHPLGVKGIGEAGTIASTCTVYNAVIDALAPLGVDDAADAADAGTRLAGHADGEEGSLTCTHHRFALSPRLVAGRRPDAARRSTPARSSSPAGTACCR